MCVLSHNEKSLQPIITTTNGHKIKTRQKDFALELFKGENHNKIIEKWLRSTFGLNENNQNMLKKTTKDGYRKRLKSITPSKKEKADPCPNKLLLMALITYQQKQIDSIKERQNKSRKSNTPTNFYGPQNGY